MFDIILINILKLIYKLMPIKLLGNKINISSSNRAHQTIIKLQKAKKNNFSGKRIKNILLLSGINLNIKDDNFYYKLLDLITVDGDLLKNRIFLKNYLQNQTFNYVDFRTWLKLRDIFYLKFEMVLGGVCRKNAVNSATKGLGFLITRKDKARARLDKILNTDDAESHLKQFPLEYNFDKKILDNFLLSIHNTKFHIKTYDNDNDNDNDNERFFKILNNKNVAIVGPTKTDIEDASEIDSFDIVIRLNFRNVSGNIDEFKKGLKTHISYYNGVFTNYLITNNKGKIPKNLIVACIKDNDTKRKKQLKKVNQKQIIRRTANYNFLTFYSSLNLLPLALLDLLETNVKSIKVFHSDLFLTINRNRNFSPRSMKKNVTREGTRKSFLDHDPMSQHEFLKKIYKNDKITGDSRFDEVMKLDTFEYLKKLEDIYR